MEGTKTAVLWCFNFDPYPYLIGSEVACRSPGTVEQESGEALWKHTGHEWQKMLAVRGTASFSLPPKCSVSFRLAFTHVQTRVPGVLTRPRFFFGLGWIAQPALMDIRY